LDIFLKLARVDFELAAQACHALPNFSGAVVGVHGEVLAISIAAGSADHLAMQAAADRLW
jgi:hypothetical protein